jgi:hypothetical protein
LNPPDHLSYVPELVENSLTQTNTEWNSSFHIPITAFGKVVRRGHGEKVFWCGCRLTLENGTGNYITSPELQPGFSIWKGGLN